MRQQNDILGQQNRILAKLAKAMADD